MKIDPETGGAMINWDEIIKAFEYLLASKTAKIETKEFKVYYVGLNLIRIDIKVD